MFFDVYSRLCKAKNMTPNGVAKILGFPSSSVTQWKNGSTPRPIALQKIADYFEVSVSYFIDGQKEKSPTPDGAGLDDLTMELKNIWDSADDDEKAALIEMARLIKKRRVK